MVIFNASAQHTAVNNAQVTTLFTSINNIMLRIFSSTFHLLVVLPVQLDYFGWMPNAPVGLQGPPPACRGSCSEHSLLDSLPDVKTTVHGLAIIYLLSKKPADFV